MPVRPNRTRSSAEQRPPSLDALIGWLGNAVNLRWLKRQIRRPDRTREDVDDLIQEAILRVVRCCERGEARDPAGILVRTVTHLSIDDCRSRARRPYVSRSIEELEHALPLVDASPMPEELVAQEQSWALIAQTLATVEQRAREAFLLNRVHGMTYPQIAKQFRVSSRTIEEDVTWVMALLIDAAHRRRRRP
jgi:RNA polymerase sigma-70 factor (ECF subfamily)